MTDNALLDLHTSGTEQRTLSPIEGILGSGFRLDSTDVPILDLLLKMTSPSAVHLHFCKLGGLLGPCQKLIRWYRFQTIADYFVLSAKFSNKLTYWSVLFMAAQWCRD